MSHLRPGTFYIGSQERVWANLLRLLHNGYTWLLMIGQDLTTNILFLTGLEHNVASIFSLFFCVLFLLGQPELCHSQGLCGYLGKKLRTFPGLSMSENAIVQAILNCLFDKFSKFRIVLYTGNIFFWLTNSTFGVYQG